MKIFFLSLCSFSSIAARWGCGDADPDYSQKLLTYLLDIPSHEVADLDSRCAIFSTEGLSPNEGDAKCEK